MTATTIPYIGFRPLRPGRIHIYCPGCGRKMSNIERTPYDPPTAVLAHVPCERCSAGCKVEGATDYLDANGESVSALVECPECGDDWVWHEIGSNGRCPECNEGDRETDEGEPAS